MFEEAIQSAKRQSAKSMELRAALRLARLQKRQGNAAEAQTLISDVYGRFTEGFERPDLRETSPHRKSRHAHDAKSVKEFAPRPYLNTDSLSNSPSRA